MKYYRFHSSIEFLKEVEDVLLEDEAYYNLPLGVLNQCARRELQKDLVDPKPYFSLIRDSNGIALLLFMTPPFNLGIFGNQKHPDLQAAISLAIDRLRTEVITIPGVIGPNEILNSFIHQWEETTGDKPLLAMEQSIYKLTAVENIPMSPGEMKAATPNDQNFVTEWIHDFSKVTDSPLTMEDSHKRGREFIQNKSLYVWKVDGIPVSIARKARSTKNGVVVNLVYTPPEYRRSGYATSCVAALSQKLLNEGYSFCSLYTDLSNPTSNSIYMKIGYKPIGSSIVYKFKRT